LGISASTRNVREPGNNAHDVREALAVSSRPSTDSVSSSPARTKAASASGTWTDGADPIQASYAQQPLTASRLDEVALVRLASGDDAVIGSDDLFQSDHNFRSADFGASHIVFGAGSCDIGFGLGF
jgi:hypothetical protein